MNQALQTVTAIYTGLFNFLFSAYISDGVSLGMIICVVVVFSLIISNLLNAPSLNLTSSKPYDERGNSSRELPSGN